MGVVCRPLDEGTAPAWDNFVRGTPGGTFFHLAAWREVIARAFGHRTYYVLTERDGAITGVLPLVHVKTRLFGNTLISNPFCVYVGPLAGDAESAVALHEYAEGLMSRLGTGAAPRNRSRRARRPKRAKMYSKKREHGPRPAEFRAEVRRGRSDAGIRR